MPRAPSEVICELGCSQPLTSQHASWCDRLDAALATVPPSRHRKEVAHLGSQYRKDRQSATWRLLQEATTRLYLWCEGYEAATRNFTEES